MAEREVDGEREGDAGDGGGDAADGVGLTARNENKRQTAHERQEN